MEELFTPQDLTQAEPLTIAQTVVRVLDAKKAGGIKLLHVSDSTVLTDYFVICTGHSHTQIQSLADEVEYRLTQCGLKPRAVEGHRDTRWVLLDYGAVIVHVFSREARDFYKLEKLWATAEEIDITSLLSE